MIIGNCEFCGIRTKSDYHAPVVCNEHKSLVQYVVFTKEGIKLSASGVKRAAALGVETSKYAHTAFRPPVVEKRKEKIFPQLGRKAKVYRRSMQRTWFS